MLKRKIAELIREHLESDDRILIIEGARRVGKTFIIRHVGKKLFKNFVEINLLDDSVNEKLFADVKGVDDFLFKLSSIAGESLSDRKDTLVFLDSIQAYPELLALLKSLNEDHRYTYIVGGTPVEAALMKAASIPMGSVRIERMYPLDFEEFLWAEGVGEEFMTGVRQKFEALEPLDESLHGRMLNLFKRYLLIGGLPQAVNVYLATRNIVKVREIQRKVHDLYLDDAAEYDRENHLKICRIYDLVPSMLRKKNKRFIVRRITDKRGYGFNAYRDEFEYLENSGISIEARAISEPRFPLARPADRNLLKLYLNDVGIFTGILCGDDVDAVLNDRKGVDLGAVYETVAASELQAHGFRLCYYDDKSRGEVDFLIDDCRHLAVLPLEIKSGKDYYVHNAINNFISTKKYGIKQGYVFSNKREIKNEDGMINLPIYYVMFLKYDGVLPERKLMPEKFESNENN